MAERVVKLLSGLEQNVSLAVSGYIVSGVVREYGAAEPAEGREPQHMLLGV